MKKKMCNNYSYYQKVQNEWTPTECYYECIVVWGNIRNSINSGPVVLKPGKMMHLVTYFPHRAPALFMKQHVLLLYSGYTKPEVCILK